MLIAVMDTKVLDIRHYSEVRIIRLQHMFYSTDFQLLSEAPYSREEARKDFWKLQGEWLGSQA